MDWVVLLSGAVGMTFAVMLAISNGVQAFGDRAEVELATRAIGF